MTRALVEKLRLNDRTVGVEWKDGHQSNFPLIWLRDHCKSEASQHPSSGHRLFETASLDASLEAKRERVLWNVGDRVEGERPCLSATVGLAEGSLHVKVERDRRAPQPVLWEGSAAQSSSEYGEMVSSANALYHFMADIRDFGFARVTSVPVDIIQSTKVVELFGYVRETMDGSSMSNLRVDAVHLAYTPVVSIRDNVYRNPMQVFSFFIAWRPVSAVARPSWWMDLKLPRLYERRP